jgi:hypothetical protein
MLWVGLTSPRNKRMQKDEREGLRKNVATENNFQLYKCYSEKDAATRIGWDYSTLNASVEVAWFHSWTEVVARSRIWAITLQTSSFSV